MGDRSAGQVAEELLAHVRAGEFEAATAGFDDELARLLPPPALRRLWEDLGGQFGDLGEIEPAKVEPADGAQVVTLRCHFREQAVDLRVTVGAGGAVSGLFLRPAPPAVEMPVRRRTAAVLLLAVPPLAAAAAALVAGQRLRWTVVLGAAGWLLALALRRPAAAVAGRVGMERVGPTTVVVSGPVEELVRLACVLLAGRGVAGAVWLGVGWGAVEAAFTVVVGWRQLARGAAPPSGARSAAGALERASALAFHVGAALLLTRWWAAVAPLALLHTVVNVSGLRVAARSPARAQALVAAVAAALLGAGVAAVR